MAFDLEGKILIEKKGNFLNEQVEGKARHLEI